MIKVDLQIKTWTKYAKRKNDEKNNEFYKEKKKKNKPLAHPVSTFPK